MGSMSITRWWPVTSAGETLRSTSIAQPGFGPSYEGSPRVCASVFASDQAKASMKRLEDLPRIPLKENALLVSAKLLLSLILATRISLTSCQGNTWSRQGHGVRKQCLGLKGEGNTVLSTTGEPGTLKGTNPFVTATSPLTLGLARATRCFQHLSQSSDWIMLRH